MLVLLTYSVCHLMADDISGCAVFVFGLLISLTRSVVADGLWQINKCCSEYLDYVILRETKACFSA